MIVYEATRQSQAVPPSASSAGTSEYPLSPSCSWRMRSSSANRSASSCSFLYFARSHSSSSGSSSSSNHSGLYVNYTSHHQIQYPSKKRNRERTRSLPLIPLFLPAACLSSFAFFIASSSASFLSMRVRFHLANVSGVTGVRLGPSLWRYKERVRITKRGRQ